MDPIGAIRDRCRALFEDDASHEAGITPSTPPRLDDDALHGWELDTLPFFNTASAEPEREKPVGEPLAAGRKYTDRPHEVRARTTTPTPGEVVSFLRQSWPELTGDGARTLAAQFMAETGGGKNCFNWNLGNLKASANEPHMYLRGVWEVETLPGAEAEVARANGLARVATLEEIKERGWACQPGRAIVVFDPPHPQTRFRAYASFGDGAQQWLARHQAIAGTEPTFLTALNGGDTTAVAHALRQARYYTAAEADYARLMAAKKAEIDRMLEPGTSMATVPTA